jgi:AcrR family transcriptional regulator
VSRAEPLQRREPVQRRSRERVETILAAASELIARDGVEVLTTRSLSEHTGIPVATIYRYFSNRDAIVAAILDRELEEIDRRVERAVRALRSVSFRSMIEAVAFAHLRHHQDRPAGVPLWFGTRLNAAVEAAVRTLDTRMAETLNAAAVGAGFIERRPPFDAGLIVLLFDRTFEHIFAAERPPQEQEAILQGVVDMIASYMERYASPAGLGGVSAEQFLEALRGSR